MCFNKKLPEFQACVKFPEATEPKPSNKKTDVVNLLSPTFSRNRENQNPSEILFVLDTENKKETWAKKKEADEANTTEEDEKQHEEDETKQEAETEDKEAEDKETAKRPEEKKRI